MIWMDILNLIGLKRSLDRLLGGLIHFVL